MMCFVQRSCAISVAKLLHYNVVHVGNVTIISESITNGATTCLVWIYLAT